MDYFDFEEIKKNDPRIADVFRLRYKVYVEEWQFECPKNHPLGIETDDYDIQSLHFAAIRRESSAIIGTARLIKHSTLGFPIEKYMKLERKIPENILRSTAEFSRLAVSKEYRRRAIDNVVYGKSFSDSQMLNLVEGERRKSENDIVLGIFKKMAEVASSEGITHLYVVMANGLYTLLKRRKINFEPIGPEMDYHGQRRPYFGAIEEILKDNEELLNLYKHGLVLRSRCRNSQEMWVAV